MSRLGTALLALAAVACGSARAASNCLHDFNSVAITYDLCVASVAPPLACVGCRSCVSLSNASW
jgi:hypothetical protein